MEAQAATRTTEPSTARRGYELSYQGEPDLEPSPGPTRSTAGEVSPVEAADFVHGLAEHAEGDEGQADRGGLKLYPDLILATAREDSKQLTALRSKVVREMAEDRVPPPVDVRGDFKDSGVRFVESSLAVQEQLEAFELHMSGTLFTLGFFEKAREVGRAEHIEEMVHYERWAMEAPIHGSMCAAALGVHRDAEVAWHTATGLLEAEGLVMLGGDGSIQVDLPALRSEVTELSEDIRFSPDDGPSGRGLAGAASALEASMDGIDSSQRALTAGLAGGRAALVRAGASAEGKKLAEIQANIATADRIGAAIAQGVAHATGGSLMAGALELNAKGFSASHTVKEGPRAPMEGEHLLERNAKLAQERSDHAALVGKSALAANGKLGALYELLNGGRIQELTSAVTAAEGRGAAVEEAGAALGLENLGREFRAALEAFQDACANLRDEAADLQRDAGNSARKGSRERGIDVAGGPTDRGSRRAKALTSLLLAAALAKAARNVAGRPTEGLRQKGRELRSHARGKGRPDLDWIRRQQLPQAELHEGMAALLLRTARRNDKRVGALDEVIDEVASILGMG